MSCLSVILGVDVICLYLITQWLNRGALKGSHFHEKISFIKFKMIILGHISSLCSVLLFIFFL